MKSSDITLSVFIFLVFIAMYFYNILAVGIKNVQDNWPEYRCNPMVMPFAGTFGHDAGQNFTYCIQTMQSDYKLPFSILLIGCELTITLTSKHKSCP